MNKLAEALESGHIWGAAIDVFPVEPKSNKETFESPLRRFDNTFLTPHIGGSTVEAQENIGLEVAEKLSRYSDNGTTTSSVNFPEVALPEHAGSHRLLHIHHNVPGIMSAINNVFSENNLNVSAQYLQTNDAIGYVVINMVFGNVVEPMVMGRKLGLGQTYDFGLPLQKPGVMPTPGWKRGLRASKSPSIRLPATFQERSICSGQALTRRMAKYFRWKNYRPV